MSTLHKSKRIVKEKYLALMSDDNGYHLQMFADADCIWGDLAKLRIPDEDSPDGAFEDAVDDQLRRRRLAKKVNETNA